MLNQDLEFAINKLFDCRNIDIGKYAYANNSGCPKSYLPAGIDEFFV